MQNEELCLHAADAYADAGHHAEAVALLKSSLADYPDSSALKDELEALDSYMMKYRKYGIVELFDNKLDGVYVSASTE